MVWVRSQRGLEEVQRGCERLSFLHTGPELAELQINILKNIKLAHITYMRVCI